MTDSEPADDRPTAAVNLRLAVPLMFATWFVFTFVDVSAKWLAVAGFNVFSVVFARYFFNAIALLIFYMPQQGLSVFRSENPKLQLLRGMCLMGGTTFNFLALQYLPLTLTTAIFFVSPLVVCLLSIPILGERVGIRRLTAIFVGFLGVLVIVQPFGDGVGWPVVLSIISMLFAATYFTLSRRIANIDNNAVAQIYASVPSAIFMMPLGLWFWVSPEGWFNWFVMVGMGIMAALGHSLLVFAHRYGPASTLAPIIYVQVIYMSVASWLIFSQPPGPWTLLGTAIIIGSGLYLWLRERQLANKGKTG